MNISRQAWHYRFLTKFGGSDLRFDLSRGLKQYTTCTYIRDILFTAISLVAFSTWMIAVGLFAIGFICCTFYAAFTFFSMGMALPEVPTIPLIIGLIGCFAVLFGVGAFLLIKLANLVFLVGETVGRKSREKKRQKAKRESLLKQVIADKKEGICTLVKFTD